MPWHFHQKYFALSIFLAFTGAIGFLASHYEIQFIASIDSILSLIALGSTMLLAVATGITSNNIRGLITPTQAPSGSPQLFGGKCPFVLPQFSQEQLMLHGCSNKYNSFAATVEELRCKKVEIARVWEDNRHVLVPDQVDRFGCLNLSCC